MTYTEWRDELKYNLLSVSDSERRRVLEYYAEAYADRREAGFSEVQIIEEFGAPYDAARRILDNRLDIEEIADTAEEAPDSAVAESGEGIECATAEPSVQESVKKKTSRGKKALKILAIFFGCMFSAAFITFFVGLALNDWQLVTKYVQREYVCETDISALRVDGTVGNINIKLYDGDKPYVKYPTSKRIYVSAYEKSGTLIVKGPEHTFPFWASLNIPDTVIVLPDAKPIDLKLSLSAGAMKVSDGEFKSCRFTVSAGTLDIGNIICDEAEFGVSAGSINLKSLNCASIKTKISAGELIGKNVSSSKINIDVSAGTVKLGLTDAKTEYNIFVSKSAGSCNVGEQTGTTDKIIKIDISAGTVSLGFKQ